jgi:NADH dehydrogenase (ubiquinone) 1 alpha subcomplex subunit 2
MSWRGSLSRHVSELRFVVDAKGASSAGAREFLRGSYAALKTMNTGTPILVRESEGVAPQVIARGALGKERTISLAGMTVPQVEAAVEAAVTAK